jgi:protein BCP1
MYGYCFSSLQFFLTFLLQGEPYHFTHLIILSRAYHLSEDEESELANSASTTRPSRPQGDPNVPKHKKQRAQENGEIKAALDGIYSFHPEDDIIIKVRAICLSD